MLVQEPVQAAIWHCLNHYAYPDAIFLAERLRAEVDSDETLFLLATCYYRSGKPAQAYSILQNNGASSSQCRYLMAKCCIDLQKDAEAEAILTGGDPLRCRGLDEIATEFGDSASFALALIAKVCCAGERTSRGIEAYRRALKLNPFLWQAYEELCKRGEKPDPVKTFSLSSLDNLSSVIGTNPVLNYVNSHSDAIETNHNNNSTPVPVINILNSNSVGSGIKPFSPDDVSNQFISRPSSKPYRYRIFTGTFSPLTLTPSFGVFPLDTLSPSDLHPSPAATTHPMPTLTEVNDQKSLAKRVRSLCDHVGQLITRKDSPLQQSKPVFSQSCNTSHLTTPSVAPPVPAPLHAAQNVRRSSRLFSNSYSVKENNKSPNRNKFVTPKSPSRKTKSRLSKTNLNKTSFNELNERNRVGSEKSETITVLGGEGNANGTILQQSLHSISLQALGMQKQSVEGLMSLLRDLGTAYLHLSQFNLKKAIDTLSNIPSRHYNTGWVLCMIGKAYFELTDYQQAVRYFNCVREREPYRTQMMELYSTSLWHLQKEAALSALAQDLVALDRNCPVAWCAAGNCFSLQKEHDTAIKFLHRAVQVDPNFAYAYTILGHEYIATEELEKAMSCFRNAVRIDSRHYNAWYGIGAIYSKQERFQLAEIHFKRALSINQHSPVLMCHIGVVQNAQQKTDLALQTLNAAIAIDPKNPLCKFHRASIFFVAGRHAEALKELEELKEIVPKESLVYYLTGKVHKKLGNTHLALMHFSWATDLDPKGANSQIKEAIDPAISQSNNDGLGDDIQSVAPASADAVAQEQPMLQMQDSDDSLMILTFPILVHVSGVRRTPIFSHVGVEPGCIRVLCLPLPAKSLWCDVDRSIVYLYVLVLCSVCLTPC